MRIEEVVGRRVAELRDTTEMSQQELGRRLGELLGRPWSRQAVSAAEKGRRAFTAAEILALAHVFEVPVARFYSPPLEAQSVRVGETGRLVSRSDVLPLTASTEVESTAEFADKLKDLKLRLSRLRVEAGGAMSMVDDLAANVRIGQWLADVMPDGDPEADE